ncbi:MAG: LuxR C-terminal-related transcriptional regulator [Brevinematales bacterium]|nr:LuxR C-terminal-related transcriptional regulator [Brevinematales bacterium]
MAMVSDFLPMCVLERESFLIKRMNAAFCEELGYDASLVGQEYMVLVVAEEFSYALQSLDSVSSKPLYVAFSLLNKEGKPQNFFHALVLDEEGIVDLMIPNRSQEKTQLEHHLLKYVSKPVFCLGRDGNIPSANEAAKKHIFGEGKVSLRNEPIWESLQSRLFGDKPFSEWIKLQGKEGFFLFRPVEEAYWLVEYQWGREEIFQRLSEIILDWELPSVVVDLRSELPHGALWNGAFASLNTSPLSVLSEIKQFPEREKYLSIPQKEGGFAYYRPLVFPFHPRVEILLVVLLEETEHVRKEFLFERLQGSLEEMIRLSEDIQTRLSGGMESFFEQYHLSDREKKLVKLIQKGFSNEEIASSLYVSVDTVKKSISHLYRKLGVNNRLELFQVLYGSSPRKIPPKS